MKKLLLSCLMLLGMAGSINATKQYLSFEAAFYCWSTWNGTTFSWGPGTNEGKWNEDWVFMAAKEISGDLSSWERLHLNAKNFTNASAKQLTVVFKKNDGSNPPSGPTKEFVVTPDENGEITIDLTNVEWGDCDITNIQDLTIYGCARDDNSTKASVDITDAYLEKPDPNCFVTYVVKDENGNTIFTSEPQGTTSGTHITTLPNEFKRGFCEYTSADVTIEDTETTVEFTATWNDCPITFYADYNSIVWKNLHLSRSQQWYLNNDPTPCLVGNPSDNDRTADSYQWGFVGNPYQYKIYNKAAGSTKTLNGSAAMAEGETIWTSVAQKGEGILFGRASDGQFLNQAGGDNNTSLGFWWDPNDAGSTFFVADVPEPSLIIGEAGWATFGSLDKSANLSGATHVYAAK